MYPIIISIEGNIGSGKSTILNELEKYINDTGNPHRIQFLKEPVDIWEKIRDSETGENILQKFYADQKKYAFPFQVMAYASRLSMIRSAINGDSSKIIICERSLEADKNIFAKMLYDDGKIDDINYQIYNHFYKEYAADCEVKGIVYIDALAEVSHGRVAKRSRDGESSISLDYLQKCKLYHDQWLGNTETPLLRIDATADTEYNLSDPSDEGGKWLKSICGFVEKLIAERDDYEELKRR